MVYTIPSPWQAVPITEHVQYKPLHIVEVYTKSGVLILSTREVQIPELGGAGGWPGAGDWGAGSDW